MKRISKVLAILFVAVCTFLVMPNNIAMAAGGDALSAVSGVQDQIKGPDSSYTTNLQATVGKLLGFLQVASGLIAILMIAIVGFNYIISTPEIKKELKDKMLPIIIGLVLVFGAVSVAKFILGVVQG